MPWLSPKLFPNWSDTSKQIEFSIQTDVYAFGTTIWEIFNNGWGPLDVGQQLNGWKHEQVRLLRNGLPENFHVFFFVFFFLLFLFWFSFFFHFFFQSLVLDNYCWISFQRLSLTGLAYDAGPSCSKLVTLLANETLNFIYCSYAQPAQHGPI